MKRFIFLFIFLISFFAKSQDSQINVQIKKAKLVDNVSFFGIRQLRVTDDRLRKVMIKTKITSSEENKTKLSAFCLLDIDNKIRYRLADYKGYVAIIGEPELIPLRKSKTFITEDGKEVNILGPEYNPNIKDYFNDYDMEGYKNFENLINFGTKNRPANSIIYFGETDYIKFTAELYFAIIQENSTSKYQLYYKDKLISDITFKQ